MKKINVVSFSGGRTSAYLVYLMEQRRINEGLKVEYVFMDTGAEHPKTYEFVRAVARHFKINLICLRTKFNPELGKANAYTELSVDDIGPDLEPWRGMLGKYGTPYAMGGTFCTDRMKLVPFKKYCDQKYGRGGYVTWLGIREDEPKRLKPKDGIDYLASISDFDKQDILNWWHGQPFDLGINEHLGNCVFCIKKTNKKVALAAKDEPELARDFVAMLHGESVRQVKTRTSPSLEMYRGRQSLTGVIQMFSDVSRDELASTIKMMRAMDTGSCSESCEVFNGSE